MKKVDQRELMIQWFEANFEDPANSTPHDEGEYVWIWGGPYDAREQLYSKFDGVASEALIEEVAEEVEREGITNWAPVHTGEDVEDWEDIDLEEPPSLDDFSDEPSASYGTPLDREARARAWATLDELRDALDKTLPAGIGHNRPPESERIEAEEINRLRPAIRELRAEFDKPNPSIARVKLWAKPLREALVATAKWAAGKLDIAANAAMTALGAAFGFWVLSELNPLLHSSFSAIIDWLNIVAKTLP